EIARVGEVDGDPQCRFRRGHLEGKRLVVASEDSSLPVATAEDARERACARTQRHVGAHRDGDAAVIAATGAEVQLTSEVTCVRRERHGDVEGSSRARRERGTRGRDLSGRLVLLGRERVLDRPEELALVHTSPEDRGPRTQCRIVHVDLTETAWTLS